MYKSEVQVGKIIEDHKLQHIWVDKQDLEVILAANQDSHPKHNNLSLVKICFENFLLFIYTYSNNFLSNI